MREDETEASPGEQRGKQRRGRRPPKKITPDYLHNYALFYLERYASSAANLRAAMMRRVYKSCAFHGGEPEDFEPMVDAEIARLKEVGLLDDAAYAEARALGLSSRGTSGRAIRAKLVGKGVGEDDIAAALGSLEEEHPEPEFAAAVTFARKRRLGPFRPEARAGRRERDLAAMSRAGFDYDMALRVIDAESVEILEEEIWRLRAEQREQGGKP